MDLPPGTLGMKTECAACREAADRRALLAPVIPPAPREPTPPARPAARNTPLLVGVGLITLLIGGALVVLIVAGSGDEPAKAPPPSTGPAAARLAAMERFGAWPYKGST